MKAWGFERHGRFCVSEMALLMTPSFLQYLYLDTGDSSSLRACYCTCDSTLKRDVSFFKLEQGMPHLRSHLMTRANRLVILEHASLQLSQDLAQA